MPGPIHERDLERIRTYLQTPSSDGSATMSGYPDTVVKLVYTETGRDSRNQPIKEWLAQGNIQPARLRPVQQVQEALEASNLTLASDIMHLPLTSLWVPKNEDRVRLVARWGRLSVPQLDFNVIGNVESNSNEYNIVLELVTNVAQ